MKNFLFFKEKSDILFLIDSKTIRINKDIKNKTELFNLFSSQLNFPNYFGKNWDALFDCLSDLSWVNEFNIIITHEDVPFNENFSEKKLYIELLSDLLISWENSSYHNLIIYFPDKYENEINNLL